MLSLLHGLDGTFGARERCDELGLVPSGLLASEKKNGAAMAVKHDSEDYSNIEQQNTPPPSTQSTHFSHPCAMSPWAFHLVASRHGRSPERCTQGFQPKDVQLGSD